MTNRCVLGLANMLNVGILMVDFPGDFYIYYIDEELLRSVRLVRPFLLLVSISVILSAEPYPAQSV